MAHLLHAIAPPRTNKGYDSSKAAGEGNLPYAEPGFLRRLAGDPGRTWNQLAQEDVGDLATTRSLAQQEHDQASQLADKEIGARSSLADKQIAAADALASKNAGNQLASDYFNAIETSARQSEANKSHLEAAKIASNRLLDPSAQRLNNAQALNVETMNDYMKPTIGSGAQQEQPGFDIFSPSTWLQRKPGIKAQPATQQPTNAPSLIPSGNSPEPDRPTASSMGMAPNFPEMISDAIISAQQGATALSPHLGVGRATSKKRKPLWKGNALPGIEIERPPVSVATR
jgi:hypothetical protein